MKEIIKKISNTLKTLRTQRSWNLNIASEKTGVSKSMLGQIERGESSPTITILWKIANGFNVPFSYFLDNNSELISPMQHRSVALQQIHPQDDKILIMPIFPYDQNLGFEIFIIELLPGHAHLSSAHKNGTIEFVIAMKGEVEILTHDIWHLVKIGQGLKFEADKPHGYRNLSAEIAVFHNIIYYQNL